MGLVLQNAQFAVIDSRLPANQEIIKTAPASGVATQQTGRLQSSVGIWGALSNPSTCRESSLSHVRLSHQTLYSFWENGGALHNQGAPMNTRPSVLLYGDNLNTPARLFDMHAGKTMEYKSTGCRNGKFSSDDHLLYGAMASDVFEMRLDGRPVCRDSASSKLALLTACDPGVTVISFDVSADGTVSAALDGFGNIVYRRVS